MDAWLEFARGPVFLFALAFMVLGLLRHVFVTSFEVVRTMRRASASSTRRVRWRRSSAGTRTSSSPPGRSTRAISSTAAASSWTHS